MISFDHVSFEYEKGTKVLDDISFTISDGESVGLVGSNGAGKSSLMKVLLGLVPHTGNIFIDELELNKDNIPAIRSRLGFVMQNSDNQMFMPTVYEDIIFAPLNYGYSREEAEQRADAALRKLGIIDLKNRHNHKLSGGEKRMAAIATILAMEPKFILMDEPSSALDPYNRRLIINTINSLDKTKLITSHDLDMIMDTCSRVLLLSDGKLAADGPADTILRDKELLEKNRMELPLSLARTV